ncbi:MAG: membrane protein insertase YidC [Thioclava marina]|uniref:membrane protein insertase YidC n=1 Tax=Thioclava TaxID=285107 RepID=UPI0009970F03|nr:MULTISPECIES: membrane protein insertase YidC [Thioclava]MBC7145010.1 membrane protein insertase YidC [Thioclava marina]OOY29111.1 membrane protein insertase YidC [Thioclava sp. L04-15]TNE83873.1 MAG: membrane protein insertase YidC [Paracoccaceae bacterium]
MDNQNKNLILAVVLSALVLGVWTYFFPPEQTAVPPQGENVSGQVASPEAPDITPNTAALDSQTVNSDMMSNATGAAVQAAPRIEIDTPDLKGSISLLGGRLDDLQLKKYKETLAEDSPDVRLLAPVGGAQGDATKPYYVVYGWMPAGGLPADQVPGPNTPWTQLGSGSLTPDAPVTLQWNNGHGLTFQREISVDDKYLFTIKQTVQNGTDQLVKLAPYGIIARHGIPEERRVYVLHEGAVRMTDGKLEEIKYKKITKLDQQGAEGQAELLQATDAGWTGFTDKYWMTVLAPISGPFTSVVKYSGENSDIYQTETRLPVIEVAPGATGDAQTHLFAGAKEWETIRNYQDNVPIQNFVDSIDWGWFYFLTKPMFRLLHWLHGAIGNMGWAIIALTFIIKLIVFPLARKSYISMAKMKELQPEMERLKEAAGDDRQKMQQGMMELYKKNKVNPAAGCLPLLIQIPIFFSLYKVIYVTIELYHAPWIGWIHDLSAPDPTSILNLFGLLPFTPPDPGSPLFILSLGVLPILLGVSMWFQQKLNPAPTDQTQAMIFAWMPWVFMFMLGSFASGLVLYWITNNTITFIQQYTIMSMHGKRPDLFGNIKSSFQKKKPAADEKK